MEKRVRICDICDSDAILRLAVATYTNEKNCKFHCCEKHLRDVKETGCEFEIFSGEDGDVEFCDGELYFL